MDQETLRCAKQIYDFLSDCPQIQGKADLILVLGSHDLRVPEHAAKLFLFGASDAIICSGGYGKMTEGIFSAPEARVFADILVKSGVPSSQILTEEKAGNTGDNFRFSRKLAEQYGMKVHRGIAVCKPYMAKRAWAAGTVQWPEAEWTVSVPHIPFSQYETDENRLKSEIELMVGDLQRLWVYADRGWQARVSIPKDIILAYESLIRQGFDRYLIS